MRTPIPEKFKPSKVLKEDKMIQAIRCYKCNATFYGSVVPYCYENKFVQKEVAKYSKLGCKIELVKLENFKFEICECKLE